MLVSLRVANLAIIDEVRVDFDKGFNVLTGETGAGKSILIGALDLILGSKGSPDIIRAGQDEAHVEGCFIIPGSSVTEDEKDTYSVSDGEIILSRKISRAGRSRCFVNGRSATLSMLQNLGNRLVTIFGQHEQRVLLDTDEHVTILDEYGILKSQRELVGRCYTEWKKAEKALEGTRNRFKQLKAENYENKVAVQELAKAALKLNEEDDLLAERDILRRAVQIREKAFDAYQQLYSRSGSIIENLSEIKKAIDYLTMANPKLESIKESFEEAFYRLEDVSLELRDIGENFRADPQRLEHIEERLALIKRLQKKYKRNTAELLALTTELKNEEELLVNSEADVQKAESLVRKFMEEYFQKASELTEMRKEAGRHLQLAMEKELSDLAMPNSCFLVQFKALPPEKASALGLDDIEFQLASNPGESPKPLAKIASGGELSRIMLALKALQFNTEEDLTIIFDEVDAGIGGHTASAVGSRLARVAEHRQVLCITHLHQVAALADHHVAVEKSVQKGRTRITVTALDYDQRITELARMLGAPPESESAKDHIRKLMKEKSLEAAQ